MLCELHDKNVTRSWACNVIMDWHKEAVQRDEDGEIRWATVIFHQPRMLGNGLDHAPWGGAGVAMAARWG